MKKIMNMNKTFAAILAASVAASAASVAENQELLESKVDTINAERGVEITGSIRAVAQTSRFDAPDADPSGLNKMPNVEKDEFVTADINFGFRPWENVRANAMLRLGAGMQEYFAAAAKTVSVAWLNVEGNIDNSFYWVVGDFRQQYSPLTLFLPGIDIMYEPQIFARKRYMAEHEQLIDGNQRNLQGANLQFRHNLNELFGEVRAEAMFARINRTAVLDLTGAEGNILPSETLPGSTQASNMDKFLVAGNFELLPMNRNLYIGATPMYIFDNEDSYSYTYRHPDNDLNSPYERRDINPYELKPQKTMVVSGRIGADVGALIGSKNLILDVMGELAISNDKVYSATYDYAYELDAEGNPVLDEAGAPVLAQNDDGENYLEIKEWSEQSLDGMAMLVNANVGYKADAWGVKLAVDVIFNDSNWFNNLAQSPKFFAQRILNSEKDGQTVKYGVHSPLYSSFDALYNFAPKFSPVSTALGTDDNGIANSDINSYNIANYNKNSWTTNVYTRSQLALLELLSDPAFQLSLPNGLATSNRVGGRGNLIANFKDFAEVQGLIGMFQQVKPIEGFKEASFMEFGGGAKVDVFKIVGFSKPLEISGSYKHSERTVDTDPAVTGVDQSFKLQSDFINAGLYVQYLPRLGINAGFQMIDSKYEQANMFTALAPLTNSKQMQWMVGLDYNIAANTWLAVNFGMINVENEYNTSAVVAAGSAAGAITLPDYYDVNKDASGNFKHEFSQMLLEASINVEF